MSGEPLLGDVLAWRDGRWRVVLASASIPTVDRRKLGERPRLPVFGPAAEPYRRPTAAPQPHTKTWRPGRGWQ